MLEHVYKSILRIAQVEPRMTNILFSSIQKSLSSYVSFIEKGHMDDNMTYRCIPIILQAPLLALGSQREIQILVDVASVVRRMSSTARQQLMQVGGIICSCHVIYHDS